MLSRGSLALVLAVCVIAVETHVAWAQGEALAARVVERFQRELERNSDRLVATLRELANQGPAARAASPSIAKLLESDRSELRIAAARALGYIGHDNAQQLVPLLDDRADARTTWVVARTLGRLGDASVIDSLAAVAESHWYPPTRAAAAEAIRNIKEGAGYLDPNEDDFFAYEDIGRSLPSCGQPYDVNRQSGSEIAVDDGRLVWSNRGEFGGELLHVDRTGVETLVLHDNVVDVHAFARSHVIVAGLAHMGVNRGRLYLLEQQGADWVARSWRELPATPYASTIENGELLVHTYGGSLVVSPNGDLRMADCGGAREP